MDGEIREEATHGVISVGPSYKDLLKSLTTHSKNKHLLQFVVDGQRVKACVFGFQDSGAVDIGAKSQVYIVSLTAYAFSGRGYWPAVAHYFIDTHRWGSWMNIRR